MSAMASQITSLTIVYSTVCSDADQRKRQSSASLAFVRGIHREPVNSPHKWPVTRKMFPFDDVIMFLCRSSNSLLLHAMPLNPKQCWFVLYWALKPHLSWDKMAAISQTIFSDAFSWMKRFLIWLKCHWSLFPRVQMPITQPWFR